MGRAWTVSWSVLATRGGTASSLLVTASGSGSNRRHGPRSEACGASRVRHRPGNGDTPRWPRLPDEPDAEFLLAILPVGHMFQPFDGLAVALFLNGDVGHGRARSTPCQCFSP